MMELAPVHRTSMVVVRSLLAATAVCSTGILEFGLGFLVPVDKWAVDLGLFAYLRIHDPLFS